jgi:hypothetical protein
LNLTFARRSMGGGTPREGGGYQGSTVRPAGTSSASPIAVAAR